MCWVRSRTPDRSSIMAVSPGLSPGTPDSRIQVCNRHLTFTCQSARELVPSPLLLLSSASRFLRPPHLGPPGLFSSISCIQPITKYCELSVYRCRYIQNLTTSSHPPPAPGCQPGPNTFIPQRVIAPHPDSSLCSHPHSSSLCHHSGRQMVAAKM